MKTVVLSLLLAATSFAANLPKIYLVGDKTPDCLDAAYKIVYVEARIGIPTNHTVYVACSANSYAKIVSDHRLKLEDFPYSFTDPRAVSSFFNAESVLRSDANTLNHDNRLVSFPNFGEFIIAHEIGHLVTASPLEWRADAWALENLKRYIRISYEDFKLAKK